MVLSGHEIRRQLGTNIVIDPFDESRLNPNSYNLTLHDELMVYEEVVLDMRRPNRVRRMTIPTEGLVLQPEPALPGPDRRAHRDAQPGADDRGPLLDRAGWGCSSTSPPVSATWASAATGRWRCSPCSRSASIAGVAICQIFYHDIRGTFTEYASDKYQNNRDIQPSLLFKELSPGPQRPAAADVAVRQRRAGRVRRREFGVRS